MKSILILFLGSILAFYMPSSSDVLVGKWEMSQVIQNGSDVSSEHNPHAERYIIFKADQTFESGGRPYGANTGKYEFNPDLRTLFLDSDLGSDDDSYWKVTLNADSMHWQGYGSEWAEGFELVHVRSIK